MVAPGFLLSFAVVAGLLLAWPVMSDWLRNRRGGLVQGAATWRSVLWNWFLGLGLVSVTAWLAGLPLVARWFNAWSPWSPLANLLAVPLVTVALALAFLSLLGSLVHPGLAVLFNSVNVWPVELALRWLGWVARWPGCRQAVSAPSLWSVGCWYLGWWLLLRRDNGRRRRWWQAAGLALVLVWPTVSVWEGRGARVQVFNAEGVAVVLGAGRAPGASWLVNAGGRRHARRLGRMLDQAGVNRPDIWLINRPDVRHVGGAEALMARPPLRLVHPGASGRFRAFMPLTGSLESAGTDLQQVEPGAGGRVGALCWRVEQDSDPPTLTLMTGWDDWRVLVSPPSPDGDCMTVGFYHAGRALVEVCCSRQAFGERYESGQVARLWPAPWQELTIRCAADSLTLEWEE
ncbi:MAG: ComEC/Rec2 family competence protein [Lentisphaerae bacterium]|nr:ComEC/Rec2 family competence protein [Lentisphaerota bacterium]